MRENHLIVLRVRIVRTQETNSFSPTNVKCTWGRRGEISQIFVRIANGRTYILILFFLPSFRQTRFWHRAHARSTTHIFTCRQCMFLVPQAAAAQQQQQLQHPKRKSSSTPTLFAGKNKGRGAWHAKEEEGKGEDTHGGCSLPPPPPSRHSSREIHIPRLSHIEQPSAEAKSEKKHSPVSKSVE